MLRKFPKSNLICRIDVSGLLAIMFALVYLFVGPASVVIDGRRGGGDSAVDYPRTNSPTPQPRSLREDALVIAITRDGTVWFDDDQVRPSELPAKVRDRVIRGTEPKFYMRVDARSRYGLLVDVMNELTNTGIRDVAFLAEKPKPLPDAPPGSQNRKRERPLPR